MESLSEEREFIKEGSSAGQIIYFEKNVKEFIKRLEEEICCLYLFSKDSNWEELEGGGSILKDDKIQRELAEKIDKLAGPKLTGKEEK